MTPKVTIIERNAVLIQFDDSMFLDVFTRLSEVEDVTTPQELSKWYNEIQTTIEELTIEGFKTLVRNNKSAHRNRFEEALIVLQGGQ
jgi:hypothetical protein